MASVMKEFEASSQLYGSNAPYVEELYERYLADPDSVDATWRAAFDAWQKEQPSQHKYEDWRRFWSRVNALLGYDYGFLGDPDDHNRIGDGLSAMQWVGMLTDAGFASIDILLRDAEKVVLAGVKP